MSGGQLLDVNVLIALTWPTHVHYATTRRWFDDNAAAGWASCPLTQLGFVRVSSNPKIIRDAVAPREAVHMLQRLCKFPGRHFWPDNVKVMASGPFASLSFVGIGKLPMPICWHWLNITAASSPRSTKAFRPSSPNVNSVLVGSS